MVARGDQDYRALGVTDELGIGNYTIANPENYEYGGREGGADAARQQMLDYYQRAQGRQGPQADYAQADADLARALSGRGRQEQTFDQLERQSWGMSTPQQALIQQNTADAIAAQRSLANSGRGFGAMTLAGRLGDQRAAQLQMLGDQQVRMQRAQDRTAAYDMMGGLLGQMQGQDVATRGALQDRAISQAGLADEQAARNDAMARYYLGERYKIGQAQTQANMAYSAQDLANRMGFSNLEAQRQERAAQRAEALENQVVSGAGQGASFLASEMARGYQNSKRSDDGYSGGIYRKSPY